uniref:Uncharacterized protein n=1 Tax=Siphoviridae sp. ctXX925 TaxID=2826370 RepID=A0A8S5R1E2_9CAUD|nr:MAG TPA: hypothetical protein [Siphoviridae sp. ctXX925]DAL21233.1 MAG TPA_asm: hypothetical protein [Caudoviricetes sp.]
MFYVAKVTIFFLPRADILNIPVPQVSLVTIGFFTLRFSLFP